MKNKYRILRATRNAGEYVGDQTAALSEAKAIIRAERRNPATIVWRREGDDICAYAAKEDMHDEDKAVARLRPVEAAE